MHQIALLTSICVSSVAHAQLSPSGNLPLPTTSTGAPSYATGSGMRLEGTRLVLAIGASDAGINREGVVRIFTLNPATEPSWRDLRSPNPVPNGHFGQNVELTADELFVSERGTGLVHVFERTNSGPIHRQAIPLNAASPSSLAVHGGQLFIGDPIDSSYPGRVHVLERSAQGWQTTRILLPPFPASQQNFGASIRVIGGQLAVAEAVSPVSSCTGRVWLYDLSNLAAAPAQLPAPIGAVGCSLFGTGIFADGSTLIVRARDDSGASGQAGAAFFYERSSNGSWQQVLKLGPPNNESNWEWGVSCPRDGTAIVSGDRFDAPRILQVARRVGSSWSSQETIALPNGSVNRPWGNQLIAGTAFLPYFSSQGSGIALVAIGGDCDEDGLSDELEIQLDPSQDCNADGTPDSCASLPICASDLNADGTTDGRDLGVLVSAWGESGAGSGTADINADGATDCVDLALMLAAWGECP